MAKLFRIFLNNGKEMGVMVIKPKPPIEDRKFLYTINGKIDKRIVKEWELIEDPEEGNGPLTDLPPLP
jgi:hypothetical protein